MSVPLEEKSTGWLTYARPGPEFHLMTAHAGALARVDHLVFASPSLDEGMDVVEALLGVRPAPGGSHPGWGTHNALLSLGATTYLEVVAPDPARPDPALPGVFGLREVRGPRLVTWALRCNVPEAAAERVARAGVRLGAVQSGRRLRPDGTELSWVLTSPERLVEGGVIPFLIDWGASPHPAASAPAGGRLEALCGEHPDPGRIRPAFEALDAVGILDLVEGPHPRLFATISTDRGTVRLR